MKKYPAKDGTLYSSKEERDARNQWLKENPVDTSKSSSLGMDQLGG
jgi:hypothetical protein